MPTFEDREKAFEAKFRLDQETEFKVHVRRDRLVGLWAAERMGLGSEAAAAYARDLVELDLLDPGTDAIFRKVQQDLRDRNADIGESALRREMDRLLLAAHHSVIEEMK